MKSTKALQVLLEHRQKDQSEVVSNRHVHAFETSKKEKRQRMQQKESAIKSAYFSCCFRRKNRITHRFCVFLPKDESKRQFCWFKFLITFYLIDSHQSGGWSSRSKKTESILWKHWVTEGEIIGRKEPQRESRTRTSKIARSATEYESVGRWIVILEVVDQRHPWRVMFWRYTCEVCSFTKVWE